MPSLFDVANHFDDIPITDGYTGAALYSGQFSSFLEASPDGSTAQRRTLSLAPGLVIPARRVLTALTERWIVGMGNLDGIYGQAIRQSFWTKKVTDTFQILTPAQAALAQSGVTAYGHREYLKDTINLFTDAQYDPFWDIYFSNTEPVFKGTFLKSGTTLYRARSLHTGKEGLFDASCDELDIGAGVAVVFPQTGAYSPHTDSYAAGSVTTTGILLDRYKLFEYRTEADAKTAAGDMSLVVAQSVVTPKVGWAVTIAAQPWRVEAVTPELDGYLLHVRRA